ncbi:ATP-binding protein [Leptotrichia shahii]|uniref:ATP-binding protein n=1 Tax=Leptotrichia shahii TaxID=157691 RepID=UPI0028D82C54|nr:ATP-binding protein [Leptotrichia shahii]
MIIKFKNLGPIERGEINLNDLKGINLIIGKNNTGKTYLSNLLYSYFKVRQRQDLKMKEVFDINFKKELSNLDYETIKHYFEKKYESEIKNILPQIFHTSKDIFKDFKIEVDLSDEILEFKKLDDDMIIYFREMRKTIKLKKSEDKIEYLMEDYDENKGKRYITYNRKIEEEEAKQIIFGYFLHIKFFQKIYKFYSFPAERSGAVLFYKQLLEERSDVLRELELGNSENIGKISRYSEPVNDYVKFLNSISDRSKGLTELDVYKKLDTELKEILGGEVIIDLESNIMFRMNEKKIIDIGMVSSTVKTLTGFYLYLKYFAMERDIIFIDEIELNLHPENQRKIMKLINYLSKQGLKFVISTHSPVITQEMNNMIMFEKCKDKIDDEIIKEYSVDRENYGLRQENVNIYFLNNKTIEQAEFGEDGVITETFNEVLGEIDNLYQELLFAMEEE